MRCLCKVNNKLPPRCPPSEPPSYSRCIAPQSHPTGDEWIEPLDVGPDLEPIMEEASPRLSGQRLEAEDGPQKRGSKSPHPRSKSRSPSGSRSSTPSKVILAVSGFSCCGYIIMEIKQRVTHFVSITHKNLFLNWEGYHSVITVTIVLFPGNKNSVRYRL